MSISTTESRPAFALSVSVNDEALTVDLSDGRSLSVPLAWYPRLLHGSDQERNHWRLIGQGHGVHWPDLDEDISISNLLDGKPSGESQRSFRTWLDRRAERSDAPSTVQGRLPENLETITISSLMDDESAYVVAGAILADEEGRLWIRSDYSFTREAQGNSHVKITRSGDSVFVDQESMGDHTYDRRPLSRESSMFPVILE